MSLSAVEKRLLALHYLYPAPKNRFTKLYEIDPTLEDFRRFSSKQLAVTLAISMEKANRLKTSLFDNTSMPYEQLYEQHKIIPIPFTSSLYPKSLLALIDPPTVLYAKGDLSILSQTNKIAIIGSRKASVYSKKALSFIVPPLVKNNVVIVSGLAKGADTMAHKATIAYGGKTIGVLGHGFFHLYPKENTFLANEMGTEHLLLTEYPPYVTPERWTFPMRNRIISGLSDAVIVTESANKSGTMSTVEHALDHGKEIYAVPGPVNSMLSEGPNRLIDEGAQPLWNGFQVVGSMKKKTF